MIALSPASIARLIGVHPALVRVVQRAMMIGSVDFQVSEGLRSAADQLAAFNRGTSKLNGIPAGHVLNGVTGTGIGNHQVQADGLGHAVDLVPYVNGSILWVLPADQQWQHIYPLAACVREAAVAEMVRLRWGGVWDTCLNDLPVGADGIAAALESYKVRHAGSDFLDGPHFELERQWDGSASSAQSAIS